jgi:hypothetical protein
VFGLSDPVQVRGSAEELDVWALCQARVSGMDDWPDHEFRELRWFLVVYLLVLVLGAFGAILFGFIMLDLHQ